VEEARIIWWTHILRRSMDNIKQLPAAYEAEVGVLGSALLDPTIIDNITLNPKDFYDLRHSVLWEELCRMRGQGQVMDAISIGEWLKVREKIDLVGGYDHLVELQSDTLVPSHSQHYADIVKEKAKLRHIINIVGDGVDRAYRGEDSSADIISGLMDGHEKGEEVSVELIEEQWRAAQSGDIASIPTPFPDLDRQCGGVRRKMVTLLTGPSKGGKSMLLAKWYNHLGRSNIPILSFPLEDQEEITLKRMAANYGKFPLSVLDNGGRYVKVGDKWEWWKTTEDDIRKAVNALEVVMEYPVYFHDDKISPDEMFGIATRYKHKYNIQGVFLDGAKDLRRPSGKYGDVGFDEEVSQAITMIAKKLDVALVSVQHTTKMGPDELITNENIRGSGNIVSDARATYALQKGGIDSDFQKKGIAMSHDEWGNCTNRIFECISTNHGSPGKKLLDTDLSKCQFYEV
jgi:replicative DNA helicase